MKALCMLTRLRSPLRRPMSQLFMPCRPALVLGSAGICAATCCQLPPHTSERAAQHSCTACWVFFTS